MGEIPDQAEDPEREICFTNSNILGGLDIVNITTTRIECKYCEKPVEGYSDSECLLNMIYHVKENHCKTIN